MIVSERILVVDDDEAVLEATGELLRLHNFECDCAPDSSNASKMFEDVDYDLIIADIRMPGNTDLEFVREISQKADPPPVILMTAYPSLETAIPSVQLPVVAYLVKPLEAAQLLKAVERALNQVRALESSRRMRQIIRTWDTYLVAVESALKTPSSTSSTAIHAFLKSSFGNILKGLSELLSLVETLAKGDDFENRAVRDILAETVETLKKTKGSFKSKDLGRLREKLETMLEKDLILK